MSEPLSPCPYLPACVCSRDDASPLHRIEPIAVTADPDVAFARAKRFVAGMRRTVIVTATDHYFHAACRNRIGLVDDLECRLCRDVGVIHIRSASRLAVWDFGLNRRRIETLRRRLQSG